MFGPWKHRWADLEARHDELWERLNFQRCTLVQLRSEDKRLRGAGSSEENHNPFLMTCSGVHKARRAKAMGVGKGIQVMYFHNDIRSVGSSESPLHNATQTVGAGGIALIRISKPI